MRTAMKLVASVFLSCVLAQDAIWCETHPGVCLLPPVQFEERFAYPCMNIENFSCVPRQQDDSCPFGYLECQDLLRAPSLHPSSTAPSLHPSSTAPSLLPTSNPSTSEPTLSPVTSTPSLSPSQAPTEFTMCDGIPYIRCPDRAASISITGINYDRDTLTSKGSVRCVMNLATGRSTVPLDRGLVLVIVVRSSDKTSLPVNTGLSNTVPADSNGLNWTTPRGFPPIHVLNGVVDVDVSFRISAISRLLEEPGQYTMTVALSVAGSSRPWRERIATSVPVSFSADSLAPSAAPTMVMSMCDGIRAHTCPEADARISIVSVDPTTFCKPPHKVRFVVRYSTGTVHVPFDRGLWFVFVIKGRRATGIVNVGINHTETNIHPLITVSSNLSFTPPFADNALLEGAPSGSVNLIIDFLSGQTTLNISMANVAHSQTYEVHLYAYPCNADANSHYQGRCRRLIREWQSGILSLGPDSIFVYIVDHIREDAAIAVNDLHDPELLHVSDEMIGSGTAAMLLYAHRSNIVHKLNSSREGALDLIIKFAEGAWPELSPDARTFVNGLLTEGMRLYRNALADPFIACDQGSVDRCVDIGAQYFSGQVNTSSLSFLRSAFAVGAAVLDNVQADNLYAMVIDRCTSNSINELWANFTSTSSGMGEQSGSVQWTPLDSDLEGLSVMVHDTPNGNARMMCADFDIPTDWTSPRGNPPHKVLNDEVAVDVTFRNVDERFEFLGMHLAKVHLALTDDPTPYRNRLASSGLVSFTLSSKSPTAAPTERVPTSAPTFPVFFQCLEQLDSVYIGAQTFARCQESANLLSALLEDCVDKNTPLFEAGFPVEQHPICQEVLGRDDGFAVLGGWIRPCNESLAMRLDIVTRKFGGNHTDARCPLTGDFWNGAGVLGTAEWIPHPHITYDTYGNCSEAAEALNRAIEFSFGNPRGYCAGPEIRFADVPESDTVVYTDGLSPGREAVFFVAVVYDTRGFPLSSVELRPYITNPGLAEAAENGYELAGSVNVSRLVSQCGEFIGSDGTGFISNLTNLPPTGGFSVCTIILQLRLDRLYPRVGGYHLQVALRDPANDVELGRTETLVFEISYESGPGAAVGNAMNATQIINENDNMDDNDMPWIDNWTSILILAVALSMLLIALLTVRYRYIKAKRTIDGKNTAVVNAN